MTHPRIIGLYSPAPQSGKTTTANYLRQHDYHRVSFAEPLKEMAIVLLENLGHCYQDAHDLVRYEKHALIPEIGVTVRHILQTLGTEYGRSCLHPEIWLACWRHRAASRLAQGHNVVVDDMRFLNEAAMLRAQGAELWQITRPDADLPSDHASDGALENFTFDYHLENTGTLADLHNTLIQRLGVQ